MKKFNLIKFGVSECKRKNIKQTYTIYNDFFKKYHGKHFTEKELFNIWSKIGIYEKKLNIDISREISMINKYFFGLIKFDKNTNKYIIEKNSISDNWENDLYENKFFGMTSIDFSFFQILLKSKYISNGKEKSTFINLIKKLKKYGYLNPKIIIDDEYILYINDLVLNKDFENICELLKLESGSSDKLLKKEKDNIALEFVEAYKSNNIDNLFETIKNYFNKGYKLPCGFSEMIFGIRKKRINGLRSFKKIDEEEIKKIIWNSIINFKESIINRKIYGSWSSYKQLIFSHFNALDNIFIFEKEKDNIKFRISKNYDFFINELLKLEEKKFLNLSSEFISPENLINELSLKNNIINNSYNKKILEKYYSDEKILNLLLNILKCFNNNERYNILDSFKIIKNHDHIKGKVDFPTFFEFIIGIIFIKKIIKSNDNEEEFIRNCFNTKLDSSLCPIRFAPGGVADIIIDLKEKGIFLCIEPTIQIHRQTKMELDAAWSHLDSEYKKKKKEYEKILKKNELKGISIISAPIITLDLFDDIKGRNDRHKPKKEIKLFDIYLLMDLVCSKKEIDDFLLTNYIDESNLYKK